MKTAKALGLDVPTSILLSADELIEQEYRDARRLDRRRRQWVQTQTFGGATVATADHLMSCLPFTPLAALRRLTSN